MAKLTMAGRPYKIGDKVRVLDAGAIIGGGALTDGKIYEIVSDYSNGINFRISTDRGDALGITDSEMYHLEPVGADKVVYLRKELEEATANVNRIAAELAAEVMNTPSIEAFMKKARAKIVADAVRDVETIRNSMQSYQTPHEGNALYRQAVTVPEFHVNPDKGVVVAIVKRRNNLRVVAAKAMAKAHPNDVFSAEVGKAIALRRAVGLDVPEEYLNLPNV